MISNDQHGDNFLKVGRRDFLVGAVLTVGSTVAACTPAFAKIDRSTIDLILGEKNNDISPDNFGYLLEVIGSSIYEGVWVGENSRIPNVGGIRRDLIEHLRKIKASVIRWPGGNFADSYDWRDGVGPRASRPRRTSVWNDFFKPEVPIGPQRYDPNQFGTDELMQLCRLTGARPYLVANARSLTPNDFNRWIEYCNSPAGSTTLADVREKGGSRDPYRVRYWGIGNEPWAYGGFLSAQEYVTEYKRFATAVPDYGVQPALIASGGLVDASMNWVARFLEEFNKTVLPLPLHAVSVHHYAGNPFRGLKAGETLAQAEAARGYTIEAMLPAAVNFGEAEWYDVLGQYLDIEYYIQKHWDVMSEADPNRTVNLAVDEWGGFCKAGTELSATNRSSRAVTLRDALGAALTLDVFNRHCDKVTVANFTGLINQEGGLFIAEGDRFLPTAIYHIFSMYAAHQGGRLVRTEFDVPSIPFRGTGKTNSLPGLAGSASLSGRTLTLTVVNPHAHDMREAAVNLRDGRIKAARLSTLTHPKLDAYNTFDRPNMLRAVESDLDISGGSFVHAFPPASASRFTFDL